MNVPFECLCPLEKKVEQKGNLKVNLFRVSLSHMHGRLNFQLKSMAAAASSESSCSGFIYLTTEMSLLLL